MNDQVPANGTPDNGTPDGADTAEARQFDRLRVCVNFRAGDILPSCGAAGSKELAAALKEEIANRGDFIALQPVHCMGKCHIGPTLKLLPGGPFLQGAQAEDVPHLVDLLERGEYDQLKSEFADPGT